MILLDVNILVTAHREGRGASPGNQILAGIGPARAGGIGGFGTSLERLPAGHHASENLQETDPSGSGA